MAKPPTNYGTWGDQRIAEGARRGESAETVARALTAGGCKDVNVRTVGRRLAAVRGGAAPGFAAGLAAEGGPPADEPAAPESGALPEVPTAEELASTDDERLDQILADAARARTRAVAEGNFTAIGAMGRLSKDVMAEKRRRSPPVFVDPNDAPDIVAAKERGIAMFDTLIAQVVGE